MQRLKNFNLPSDITRRKVLFSKGLTKFSTLRKTALHGFHKLHNGKMVPFAGWDMPVSYSDQGILASHHHTRKEASLFDVSHMMQLRIDGKDSERFLEKLTVVDLQALENDCSCLSVFTNESGGIVDDTMITRKKDHFYVVTNAGCAEKVWTHLTKQKESFSGLVNVQKLSNYSLLAVQGPKAASVVSEVFDSDFSNVYFMNSTNRVFKGKEIQLNRCGYTGEDGFEISVPSSFATEFADILLKASNGITRLAGLGARDSLRLEAGLCLYGNDIDETTSPVEASLTWTISKRRKKEGGFIGSSVILRQLEENPIRRRVGLIIDGAPARAKSLILSAEGKEVGIVTSGCPSPVLGKNIAMGYVPHGFHKLGSSLKVLIRNKQYDACVTKMPFVQNQYYRRPNSK